MCRRGEFNYDGRMQLLFPSMRFVRIAVMSLDTVYQELK